MENYFNYFTEIEECYRQCRGTPTLLSAIDWALVEAWKEAGIPLEAVCAGIRQAFEKFARRPHKFLKVNGLGYCTQTVMLAAEKTKTAVVEGGTARPGKPLGGPPFSAGEVLGFLERCAEALDKASASARLDGNTMITEDLLYIAAELRNVAGRSGDELLRDLQGLERSLTVLEEKLTASLTRGASLELLARAREDVERGIVPFRRTMSGLQIESLQSQFLKKRLFEQFHLPRLSLFYL